MKGGPKPPQGLRIQEKKYTILRNFHDDDAGGAYTVYGKKVSAAGEWECVYPPSLTLPHSMYVCV